LVHISQLSNTYVSDPNEVVKLQQKVMVTVMEVDVARKRISLSMKGAPGAAGGKSQPTGSSSKGGNQRPDAGGAQRPGAGGKGGDKKPQTLDPFQAKLMELKKKFKD
jgi:uncharacterized protein